MALSSSTRCCLNVLGFASRSSRAVQLSRPQRFNLPSLVAPRSISHQPPSSSSSDDPKPKTSTPLVPSPAPSSTPPSPPTSKRPLHPEPVTFNFKFSSITTFDTLARVLKVRRLVTPSELALLPELEQRQRKLALHILTKASKMDPTQRTAYFNELDSHHRPLEVLERSRRDKAKGEIELGRWDEEDALSAEEWEEVRRVKREAKLEEGMATEGWDRKEAMKKIAVQDKRYKLHRRRRLERLEVRREMKEAEEAEKGSK